LHDFLFCIERRWSLQVLTGVATLDDARAEAADSQPHYFINSLGDVAAMHAEA
jgi:ribonucleotide monophosphatase NagD (HAD superfamily)